MPGQPFNYMRLLHSPHTRSEGSRRGGCEIEIYSASSVPLFVNKERAVSSSWHPDGFISESLAPGGECFRSTGGPLPSWNSDRENAAAG